MKKILKINAQDNVIIALQDLNAGEQFSVGTEHITLQQTIPAGHKIAIELIEPSANIIKYGFPIGHATKQITIGEHVHSHNVQTNLGELTDYHYQPIRTEITSLLADREIRLYRRKNGEVAIRNQLWIIPTVGCVNGIATQISKQFIAQLARQGSDFTEVYVLTHPYGCSQLGEDHNNTRTLLHDMVKHPNAGGVLVIGLGCENNQLTTFRDTLGEYEITRVCFMTLQQESDEISAGIAHLNTLYQQIKADQRVPGKLSELKFGLECGGSDGLSGITANPLLGQFSDYIISHGGTSVLTEVPEMFGAETMLMAHCVNEATFTKTVTMINNFKRYFRQYGQPIYENPSPGNKAGGITTLEDKSLGCTQKAGNSQVVDVLEYGQRLHQTGLNLLSAPGNDAVATSALIAAGCHMVLFSTGRGTPYGGFAPTVKLASNSRLAQQKASWIDFNAGQLVEGIAMPELLNQFINLIVNIANGTATCNEINACHELAIFKNGVTE